jgi:hypothetical protein
LTNFNNSFKIDENHPFFYKGPLKRNLTLISNRYIIYLKMLNGNTIPSFLLFLKLFNISNEFFLKEIKIDLDFDSLLLFWHILQDLDSPITGKYNF